jgi:hypothetical protein
VHSVILLAEKYRCEAFFISQAFAICMSLRPELSYFSSQLKNDCVIDHFGLGVVLTGLYISLLLFLLFGSIDGVASTK